MTAIECPFNYFGKGVDYELPDDPVARKEFEERFNLWIERHPDDETGEKAYLEWKSKKKKDSTLNLLLSRRRQGLAIAPQKPTLEKHQITLEIPSWYITKLKNYAKMEKMRPRDVVIHWIENYAKL